MTETFRTLFQTRIDELVADLLLYNKPTDSRKAPEVIETMLPLKSSDYTEFDQYPHVCWAIHSGGFSSRNDEPFSIVLAGAVYAESDIVSGTEDLLTLTNALGKIVERRAYDGYLLQTPVTFTLGSRDKGREGLQPHPLHWVHMSLDFTVQK